MREIGAIDAFRGRKSTHAGALDVAREQLALAARQSLLRTVTETERLAGAQVGRGGRRYVSFSCNDYLGLAHDPRVIGAARQALERYGAGAGASRLVTGSHPAYVELEQRLAEIKGAERALVFGSGYLANLGVIPALVGKNDLILADQLSHACTWDGARLSGATLMRFDHNRLEHCQELLKQHRAGFNRCLILTETVFSMEGDRAPVAELSELALEHDAWLMTDDAHGLGIHAADPADVQMGTLSKAAGSYGGYVCARSEVIAFLENRAEPALCDRAAARVGRRGRRRPADHAGRRGSRQETAGKRTHVHGCTRAAAGSEPDRARYRG